MCAVVNCDGRPIALNPSHVVVVVFHRQEIDFPSRQ